MMAFAQLVGALGGTAGTNAKLQALAQYFRQAPDADKVWTIAIFSGRRPKRFVNTRVLQHCCMQHTGLPVWLFEECYHTVGDLAETIALLVSEQKHTQSLSITTPQSLAELIQQFVTLQKAEEREQQSFVTSFWQQSSFDACFVFNKLITGGFRIGVSQKTMVNALQIATGIDAQVLAHRISGQWDPASVSFEQLVLQANPRADASKPYPFCLAYPLTEPPNSLGALSEWQAEWKWDGIRGQIIKRNNTLFVWSRGEELMTDRFPEMQAWLPLLPDGVVLDGEIMCLQPNTNGLLQPMPFALLQTRIGRKSVSRRQLQDAPAGFVAYDLLEYHGEDMRQQPLAQRRAMLENLVQQTAAEGLHLSPAIHASDWSELSALRQQSRQWNSEGLMLKRRNSPFVAGRKVGDWWKWKIDPLTIDAVMIYAQKGHGRRSNLYTDYTFAVRDGDKLVSFAKAYSGLTDKEFAEVDAFVKKHAIEKFGPVRTVPPQLVFEIAFEGLAASKRHKSGVALRFPRISRWRKDKLPQDINTVQDLKQMLAAYGSAQPEE